VFVAVALACLALPDAVLSCSVVTGATVFTNQRACEVEMIPIVQTAASRQADALRRKNVSLDRMAIKYQGQCVAPDQVEAVKQRLQGRV